MLMWKCSVKVKGVEKCFVGSRGCVREWLVWMMERNYCECGMVWVKECRKKEDLVFEFENIEYVFYRKGREDKVVWERWSRRIV